MQEKNSNHAPPISDITRGWAILVKRPSLGGGHKNLDWTATTTPASFPVAAVALTPHLVMNQDEK
jgi:hypothetical protein